MAKAATDGTEQRLKHLCRLCRTLARTILFAFLSACACHLAYAAEAPATLDPVPAEVSSTHFRIAIPGASSSVMHAAAGYYTSSLETNGPVVVTITASDPHYWDAGVEVQPMRFGIRPTRQGASITFTVPGPSKLSIERPGDHFGDSEMLFLFANAPEVSPPNAGTPHLRYYGPGVHHQNIDARSGDRIYLAPGAVVLGALNLWQVHDVRVSGRGTIIYDGPQDPDHDQGWMHKRNWHLIVMDRAHDISIEGISGVVRSRTWMIQMRDSGQVEFANVKIIGGSPGNANQDGMDWLGGGDTVVRDSFFRAADDVFAMYGNWDGYEKQKLMQPGHPVAHILIEGSTLSTSISNIVRLGWPEKTFDSTDFQMRDSDVLHMGFGNCKVPFALFELWADPGGRGEHRDIRFENVRMEDWYSLTQIMQRSPSVRDVIFDGIWAMDGPGMTGSVVLGDVTGVNLHAINAPAPAPMLQMQDGATPANQQAAAATAAFDVPGGLIRPGAGVAFHANGPDEPGLNYTWSFGDGTTAQGHDVVHAFPDDKGTLLDGSGRYRVLLHASSGAAQSWASHPVVVAAQLEPALSEPTHDAADELVRVPLDGGYTVVLLSDGGEGLQIDDLPVVPGPTPRPLACGTPGHVVLPVRATAALAAGIHRVRIVPGAQSAHPTGAHRDLMWDGPAQPQLARDASIGESR